MISILDCIDDTISRAIRKGIKSGHTISSNQYLLEAEYEQYTLDFNSATKYFNDNLPNNIKIEKFTLLQDNAGLGYYGVLHIKLEKKDSKTSTVSIASLTPAEIYEKNKDSTQCVGCGKSTQQKAVLSSMINYCEFCSG